MLLQLLVALENSGILLDCRFLTHSWLWHLVVHGARIDFFLAELEGGWRGCFHLLCLYGFSAVLVGRWWDLEYYSLVICLSFLFVS